MRFAIARLVRRVPVLLVASALAGLAMMAAPGRPAISHASTAGFAGMRLNDVASRIGLSFRQGAFRFGVSPDPPAETGGGLCALDYNNDGWVDLFVVNSYAQADAARWEKRGGLPRSALFRNTRGHFRNVTRASRAGLAVRGQGCVAADFNGDGYADLVVTADGRNKLLWNNRNGTFTEGAWAAGIRAHGWYAGAAVADVNGDGRPDLFVAGYTDPNIPVPNSSAGFPNNVFGVRDLLYLNVGRDRHGRSRFREVGVQSGLEAARFDHSLGAVFSDFDGDGRPDLYVANDGDPNRLYENVPWPGGRKADPAGLGFRFEERAAIAGVADPSAGMGVAAADFDGDGRIDIFSSNSRGQGHAVYSGQPPLPSGSAFKDVRSAFGPAFGGSFTGWGASWVDLDLDGSPDLVLANGGIPVTNLARTPHPIQLLETLGPAGGGPPRFTDGTALVGGDDLPRVVGRGLTTADFRKRRTHGHRDQHDRRKAAAPATDGCRRPLAWSPIHEVLARSGRHRRSAGRPPAGARGASGVQLPLLRGSTSALRPRHDDERQRAGRSLPRRSQRLPRERSGRPDRRRAQAEARARRTTDYGDLRTC